MGDMVMLWWNIYRDYVRVKNRIWTEINGVVL